MKRIMVLAACLMLIFSSACAQVLPDAGICLDVSVQQQMKEYVFSQDYVCDVWVYPRDSRTDDLLADWIMQALDSGYTVSRTVVEGQTAYRLEDETGLYALMFPQYQGAVMLMIQQGMDYVPAMPTPVPEPVAQPADVPFIPDSSGGEWIWVEVEKDCPSCINGKCSVCDGSGIYRLYGEEVMCDPSCSSCDGLGTYTTREYQQIFNN